MSNKNIMKGGDNISTKIKANTSGLLTNKTRIESERTKVENQLSSCLTIIEGLASSWTGDMYDLLLDSYKKANNDMFIKPVEKLKTYTNILGDQVIKGYDATEKANKDLAGYFK